MSATAKSQTSIARLLLEWYRAGHRDLPWRRISDPYRIWVSEIMLQQTRAQTVIPYYERFLERFPTLESLAGAPETDLLALWSGLGYYSRARNLKRAAEAIVRAGDFPRDYDAIRALPGIGDYTAAAIGSIAFGLPHAVVDGNVLRVVARVENDASDITAPRTRQRFRAIAQDWLDQAPRDAGTFNQALMELGAVVCLPRNPACSACPLRDLCRARDAGTTAQLPVKLRRQQPVSIRATVLLVRRGDEILLKQRSHHETRMPGFWDLPGPEDLPTVRVGECCGEFRHSITHHRYTVQVFRATLGNGRLPGSFGKALAWFHTERLGEIPLSTTARKGLKRAAVPCHLTI